MTPNKLLRNLTGQANQNKGQGFKGPAPAKAGVKGSRFTVQSPQVIRLLGY
jgi:hypothetical protein